MIDKDQIFYLQSRGLSWSEAEEMIVAGFFEEGIQRIPLESVQERLRESIQEKLSKTNVKRNNVKRKISKLSGISNFIVDLKNLTRSTCDVRHPTFNVQRRKNDRHQR